MNETPAVKKRLSISSAATLLIGSSILGQLLGIFRTRLVNANFSALGPHSTDAYFAAFNIPDFFFFTLAAGALGVAFMPVLADRLAKGDRKGMWELSTSLMNLLAIVMVFVGVVILVFARPLVHDIVAPAMSPAQLNTTVAIMRLLAFNPLLFTVSGVLTGTQQALGKWFFYALSPLFYNTCIIISIFVFRHNIGIVGLGIGALTGALLQLAVVCCGLFGTKFYWSPKILWRNSEFRTILKQLPPRSMDQGMDQMESIVETHFARNLGSGYISYYNNAYTLSTAPTLLIGTAISTAAFPHLNNRLSQGRPDLFRRDFLRVLRVMIWLAMPVTIICFFARGYLARMIFAQNAPEISLLFGFLAVAIFAGTLYTLLSRWFYAHKDTKTPLFVSIFTITFDIILVSILAKPGAYGATGLAITQSIVALTEVIILGAIMLYRDRKLFDLDFISGLFRIIAVTGFSVLAGIVMVTFYPLGLHDRGFFTLGGKLFLIAGVVMVVHIGMSALFGLDEVKPIFNMVRKIIRKPLRVV
jgi:putative peptidoglycan lipid II flippase